MIKRNIFLLSILFLFAPPTPVVTSVFSLQCMIHIMRVGRQKGAEQVEGLQLIRTGIELLLAQTMARYGPCILRNWMMKEGPPATIWGGRWVRGQFSMLMMDSLLQRASSNGRLCRLGLSLRYSSSKFSSVPEDRHYAVLVEVYTVIKGNCINKILFFQW